MWLWGVLKEYFYFIFHILLVNNEDVTDAAKDTYRI